MSFKERVDSHRADLNKSDLAIVDVLLSNPAGAALWRGEDVAARARVHPSAVTRTSKKLGYKGFLELRADLRDMHSDFLAGNLGTLKPRAATMCDGSTLGTMVQPEIDNFTLIPKNVKQRDIDAAADLIMESERIYIYGRSDSALLSEMYYRRLGRFGLAVHDLTDLTAHENAEAVLTMTGKDVLVVFEFRKASKQLRHLLAHAEKVGARILLVTDNLQILSPIPDIVLASPRGARDGWLSMSVPLMIANSVIVTIGERYEERVKEYQDRLDRLKRVFGA